MLAKWLEAGYFHPEPEGTPDENFSIAIPPPNVTGELHMGHALNATMQDMLIRFNRMSGQAHEVDLRDRPRRHRHAGAGREAARRRGHAAARSWAARSSSGAYGSGASTTAHASSSSSSGSARRATTSDERFTLDEGYVRAVMKVFVDLYDKGYIYRDNYMVNWDPGTRLRDLRPRGRGPRGRGHPLLHRLPAGGRQWRRDRRHRAAGDDAGRHRRRGEPRATSATATSSASTRSCRWSAGACRSSPTTT